MFAGTVGEVMNTHANKLNKNQKKAPALCGGTRHSNIGILALFSLLYSVAEVVSSRCLVGEGGVGVG